MVVCFDFDGVLHRNLAPYTTASVVADEPTAGAVEFCWFLHRHEDALIVHSCRSNFRGGNKAMADWLRRWGFPPMEIVYGEKPIADLYIDDRGYRFTGSWSELYHLHDTLVVDYGHTYTEE